MNTRGGDYQIHQFHQNIWVGLWIGWQKMLMGLISLPCQDPSFVAFTEIIAADVTNRNNINAISHKAAIIDPVCYCCQVY
jgi:hypothetical protein